MITCMYLFGSGLEVVNVIEAQELEGFGWKFEDITMLHCQNQVRTAATTESMC